MNKGRAVWLMRTQGDSIVTYKDPVTRVVSDYLCTVEFKNKYIRKLTRGRKPWPKERNLIVVFNWTDNRYWITDPKDIIRIQPLENILQNVRD